MSKYVPDIMSRRWVIVAPNRTDRPEDTSENHQNQSKVCPFCPENEAISGPEVFRIGAGEADKPGWKVRVVPNKYPITDYHEVIIHTADCHTDIVDLPISDVELIFQAYRQRYNIYKSKGEVIIFCNKGEHAGASIAHAHSQLVVIPSQISLDALSREPIQNVVDGNHFFNVYCPDFSQWPYEVWIAPKKEQPVFGDITDEEITDLSEILQRTLRRLEEIYGANKRWATVPFGYNYYISPKDNWFLRIIPRWVHRAGFELGTGLSVNVVDPVQAANDLKGVGEKDKLTGVMDKLKKY